MAELTWAERVRLVDWIHRPTREDDPAYADGTLNTCFNALDRHVVAGRSDEPALRAEQTLSYARLLEKVATLAGALRGFGVQPGEVVALDLPSGSDLVVAMLACVRIGAVHAVDAAEPAQRVRIRRGSDGHEVLVDGEAHAWNLVMKFGLTAPAECVEVAATAPVYVDPATGEPRATGEHAVSVAVAGPEDRTAHGEVYGPLFAGGTVELAVS